jgi:anti-sigma B factor antagonist
MRDIRAEKDLIQKEYMSVSGVQVMGKITINHSLIREIPVLSISGRIDAVTSKELEDTLIGLIEQGKKFLVVDMEKVEYLSSSGLRVFMASLYKLQNKQGDLLLAALQPFVNEVFVLTGAVRFFSIHPSLGDAVESLRKEAHNHYLDIG